MKFYNRTEELAYLYKIGSKAAQAAYFTILLGRRQVGKTALIRHYLKSADIPALYFFVSKKNPSALLEEFAEILSVQLPLLKQTRLESFDAFFAVLFDFLQQTPAVVVFDEFQNFQQVDPAVFSILQKFWDTRKDNLKGHLIVIGSIISLMRKIFEDEKEPLFNRPTGKLRIEAFDLETIKLILEDHAALHSQRENRSAVFQTADQMSALLPKSEAVQNHPLAPQTALLNYYALFGGIPRYYFLLERAGLFGRDLDEIIRELILEPNALLREEGRQLVIEAFGKESAAYFSILAAIAAGHTQLSAIASQAGVAVTSASKYLDELASVYQIIERRDSVPSNGGRKNGRYYLNDNFLAFWFRYVYRNLSTLEIANTSYLTQIIQKDLTNYLGPMFERLVQQRVIELNRKNQLPFPATQIGSYWDRGQTQIDLVAWSEHERRCLVGECKLNSKRIDGSDVNLLRQRGAFVQQKTRCENLFLGFFVADEASDDLRRRLKEQGFFLLTLADLFAPEKFSAL
jgi:hypothetical protein